MIITILQIMFLKTVKETCDGENQNIDCYKNNHTTAKVTTNDDNSYWIPVCKIN